MKRSTGTAGAVADGPKRSDAAGYKAITSGPEGGAPKSVSGSAGCEAAAPKRSAATGSAPGGAAPKRSLATDRADAAPKKSLPSVAAGVALKNSLPSAAPACGPYPYASDGADE